MSREVHGHDVIDLILDSKQAYTRASLTAAIIARFGPDTRYHTCFAAGLSAAELIDFLTERGKFKPLNDGFTVDHASLLAEFPELSPHPVLPKWLYLPETANSFERTTARLVSLAGRRDTRLGVTPQARKKKSTTRERWLARAIAASAAGKRL